MGFFDTFKTNVTLTPSLAMGVAMIYMMSSDGEMADEEINYLVVTLHALGDVRTLIDQAAKYTKKTAIDAFIEQANTLLNPEQKVVVCANMADLLLSDGSAEPQEEELFFRFVNGWGVSHETIGAIVEAIALKNNYTLFH